MSQKAEEIVDVPPSGHETISLPTKWVFWYLIPNRTGQNWIWSEYLHPLHSFQSIDDFWRIW